MISALDNGWRVASNEYAWLVLHVWEKRKRDYPKQQPHRKREVLSVQASGPADVI